MLMLGAGVFNMGFGGWVSVYLLTASVCRKFLCCLSCASFMCSWWHVGRGVMYSVELKIVGFMSLWGVEAV